MIDGEIKHNEGDPFLTEKELCEVPLPFLWILHREKQFPFRKRIESVLWELSISLRYRSIQTNIQDENSRKDRR